MIIGLLVFIAVVSIITLATVAAASARSDRYHEELLNELEDRLPRRPLDDEDEDSS